MLTAQRIVQDTGRAQAANASAKLRTVVQTARNACAPSKARMIVPAMEAAPLCLARTPRFVFARGNTMELFAQSATAHRGIAMGMVCATPSLGNVTVILDLVALGVKRPTCARAIARIMGRAS